MLTLVYLCLLVFIYVYHCLFVFTYVYPCFNIIIIVSIIIIIILQDYQKTISSSPEGMAETSPNTLKTKEKLKRDEGSRNRKT